MQKMSYDDEFVDRQHQLGKPLFSGYSVCLFNIVFLSVDGGYDSQ